MRRLTAPKIQSQTSAKESVVQLATQVIENSEYISHNIKSKIQIVSQTNANVTGASIRKSAYIIPVAHKSVSLCQHNALTLTFNKSKRIIPRKPNIPNKHNSFFISLWTTFKQTERGNKNSHKSIKRKYCSHGQTNTNAKIDLTNP